jgi:hypothetical protein
MNFRKGIRHLRNCCEISISLSLSSEELKKDEENNEFHNLSFEYV